jgi:hypothetical protein
MLMIWNVYASDAGHTLPRKRETENYSLKAGVHSSFPIEFLTLTLFMARVFAANDADNTVAPDHFAVTTHLFY